MSNDVVSEERQQRIVVAARSVVVRRSKKPVLDHLDLDLAAGEVVAVMGPSGSGKSTLLHALCGLLGVDGGTIEVGEQRVSGERDKLRSRIRLHSFGLVFQANELVPELTLVENVSLPLRLLGDGPGTEQAMRELARLDIAELADRLPAEVSGGQAQRAAVARAVVHNPTVVLADEPTSALDEAAAGRAMELLIDLARERNIAVLIVTHDRTVASRCDRVLKLAAGTLSPVTGTSAGLRAPAS